MTVKMSGIICNECRKLLWHKGLEPAWAHERKDHYCETCEKKRKTELKDSSDSWNPSMLPAYEASPSEVQSENGISDSSDHSGDSQDMDNSSGSSGSDSVSSTDSGSGGGEFGGGGASSEF